MGRSHLRFQLTRLDIVLLSAVLLTSSLWGLGALKGCQESRSERRVSSWRAEEKKVQEQLQGSLDEERIKAKIRQDPSLRGRIEIVFGTGFLLAVGSLLSFIRLAFRVFRGRPIAVSLGQPAPPAWTLREILQFVSAIIVLVYLLFLGVGISLKLLGIREIDNHLVSLGSTLLIDGAVILSLLALFFRRRWLLVRDLIWSRIWPCVQFAIRGYVAFLPVLAFLLLLTTAVLKFLGTEPAPQAVFTIYMAETRTPVLVWLLALVAVAGPIAEEMFFRGILYGWLRVRIGVMRGLLLSAFLFALLHADPVAFMPIFGLGILFGWVYEKTGSLAAPIVVHVLHNSGMLYVASLIKALSAQP